MWLKNNIYQLYFFYTTVQDCTIEDRQTLYHSFFCYMIAILYLLNTKIKHYRWLFV